MKRSFPARSRARFVPLATLGIAACLGACGGGGGGGSERAGTAECRSHAATVGIPFEEALEFGLCQAFFEGAGFEAASGSDVQPVVPSVAADAAELEPMVDIDALELTDFPLAVPHNASLADLPGSNFYPDAGNSTVLQGPVIGNGSIAHESLARSVPFAVGWSDPDLVLIQVNAVRRVIPGDGDRRLG